EDAALEFPPSAPTTRFGRNPFPESLKKLTPVRPTCVMYLNQKPAPTRHAFSSKHPPWPALTQRGAKRRTAGFQLEANPLTSDVQPLTGEVGERPWPNAAPVFRRLPSGCAKRRTAGFQLEANPLTSDVQPLTGEVGERLGSTQRRYSGAYPAAA